ncbi:MAG: gamma-glutamyl-gamma-aminobutyrate hydrolase family protein [Actinomycetota bacterium]|nr:gamma-glutamyl-gamma-aminobutyrate hydrolase family protein [Actinomycetota bacterium]
MTGQRMNGPGAPLIGITGRGRKAGDLSGQLPGIGHTDIELHFTDYARAVAEVGGVPVLISAEADPAGLVARLDGILFSGGADIQPACYGAEPDPDLGGVDPPRDEFELALATEAFAADAVVLGICRGVQLLNVARGGTLCQHVPTHDHLANGIDHLAHPVTTEPGTRLRDVLGAEARVNSLHHQVVDRPGEGMVVSGRADDGAIEATELPGADVLAVQWHPEWLPGPSPVVAWLVERAAARRP